MLLPVRACSACGRVSQRRSQPTTGPVMAFEVAASSPRSIACYRSPTDCDPTMTDDEARELIRSTLGEVAPEADLDQVEPGEALQEALDLDSIDFLNFVVGLHEATGLEIPE